MLGYDVEAVDGWIAANASDLRPPYTWTQLQGGHSNLTYLIEDAEGSRAVVRRPPLGELQPRAHDMAREFRVISALWPTPVPVARPYALCQDTEVTGAVFYVMGYVGGHTGTTDWVPDDEARRRLSLSFIDTVAAMHSLDVDEIGLGDLARKDSYVQRQLKSWYRSWTTSAQASYDDPRTHEVHDWLQEHIPAESTPRLVHGDLGFHNLIVGDDARLAAVVDWEVCTLGEPLSDLAFVINRWNPATHGGPETGWLRHDEMIARYEEKTGADLARLPYFIAFNYWRSACIQHGVYTRYVRGQKSHEGVDVDHFRQASEIRLGLAVDAIRSMSAQTTISGKPA
ncbi:MAG: phosphotransferase family protein [Acidimicrobiales bacterium]|nr:phosphotransferase family protein [Acidimicrobiales bacterium]